MKQRLKIAVTGRILKCLRTAVTACILFSLVSCGEDDQPLTPAERSPVCDPSAPESLLCSIKALYNDRTLEDSRRLSLYDSLFSRDFVFVYFSDIGHATWGIDAEVEAHRRMFTAQDNGEIYALTLFMTDDSAHDLDPPQQGREGWKEVFVSSVFLRLMFNLNDGLEVNGGQAHFLFPPPVGGRWYIGQWTDLPRPGPERGTVESTTWAGIKANYLP